MIRAPLLPCDDFWEWSKISHVDSSALTILTKPGALEDLLGEKRRIAREWLHKQIGRKIIQEAILVGSPDLYNAIERYQADPESKRGRRIEAKLLRYVIRMMTRPTPFGLFAGVGMGRLGSTMDLYLGLPTLNRKYAQPDVQWLFSLVREVERRPEVLPRLRFFTNPASFVSGGRLYLPHLAAYAQADGEKAVSIRATSVVKCVLSFAERGASFGSLQEELLRRWPSATEDQVRGVLTDLCEQEALLSELRPPLTCEAPSQYVHGKVRNIPGCDDVAATLETACRLAHEYNHQPIGQGILSFIKLKDVLSEQGEKSRSLLAIDMSLTLERRTIAESIVDEVARAAEVMLRISTFPRRYAHLSTYRRDFIERYGEGCEVPLLALLDEGVGLGAPPTYLHPPRLRDSPPTPQPRHDIRERTLMDLAAKALRRHLREVDLTDEVISSLQVHESWQELVAGSMEVYVLVAAPSAEAINEGDFSIVIGPRVGTDPAGRSFGRFCSTLGYEAVALIRQQAQAEEARHPGSIFAELIYLPADGHMANVVVHPPIREHEVVLGVPPGVPAEAAIPVHDLVVGIRGDLFYLRSISHNAEVIIRNAHLLNFSAAPNICRFLGEIAEEGILHFHAFDWGSAAQLPFLPRLCAGKAILRPAEWHVSKGMLGTDIVATDSAQWYRCVQAWRQDWDVPRYVYLSFEDNRLLLDLENPQGVSILGEEYSNSFTNGQMLLIQEMTPDRNGIWAEGADGRYLLEFVVPLKRRQMDVPAMDRPKAHPAIAPFERLSLPGGEWLYAKLYCGLTRHDDLLGGPIREFTQRIMSEGLAKQWFFVRYADPDPHLRLRFEGNPALLLSKVMPALATWGQDLVRAGLIHRIAIDSYEREIDRYGGIEGIKVAEGIFSADSVVAADVLALETQRMLDLPVINVAMLIIDDLLSNLGVPAHERLDLYQTIRQRQQAAFGWQIDQIRGAFHDLRKTAQRALGDRQWLSEQPGGQELLQCLTERAIRLSSLRSQLQVLVEQGDLLTSQSPFLSSCIHMSCNRLIGINRYVEFKVIYFLERTLEGLIRYTPSGIDIN